MDFGGNGCEKLVSLQDIGWEIWPTFRLRGDSPNFELMQL